MFPETSGKTLEEVESMFLLNIPAWKTKVEYGKILAVEHGDVDPEKLAAFNVVQHQEEATEEKGGAPEQAPVAGSV